MGGVFGLGILLTLTDKVSSPLGSINSSLKKTQNEAEATQKALNNITLDAKANTSFAGGKFTDVDGSPFHKYQKHVMASNGFLHDKMEELR